MSAVAPSLVHASRAVHVADGVAWVANEELTDAHAIVTSLPDVSEMPALSYDAWRSWFVATARLICERLAPRGVAVFYQTDIKREGRWIDKGFLVSLGAEQAQSHCLFHKVICRVPPGITTYGRPAFAHVLGFSRELRIKPANATPDVLSGLGHMTWSRAMGANACRAICAFLLKSTPARIVVDPFCGLGTVLAAANEVGLDAIGIDISKKRARKARGLMLPPGGNE
jgi:hypothetical protein